MSKPLSIVGQWQDNGDFWITVDDGKEITMTIVPMDEALEFLRKANAGAARLNREGKLGKAA